MAPEYVLHGFFSLKSDVYSFGVLVLEIITGRKNRGSQNGEYVVEDLLSFVSIQAFLVTLSFLICFFIFFFFGEQGNIQIRSS